ncbi:MAG: C1 family peptidase [Chitinophagaceae bacterium]
MSIAQHPKNQIRRRIILLLILLCVIFLGFYLYKVVFQEHKKSRRGLMLPKRDLLTLIPFDSLPQKFLLRKTATIQDLMPPAGDQLDQGSCAAFTIAYYLVSYYEKRRGGYSYDVVNNIPNYSKIFSPSFVFNSIKNEAQSTDCNTGVDYTDIFPFVNTHGICKWSDFPYTGNLNQCSKPPTNSENDLAKQYLGYRFFQIDRSLSTCQTYLSAGIPLIVGLWSSKNMDLDGYAHKNDLVPFYWTPQSTDIDDYHAMLCVGYDNANFILLNSWGIDWGVKGYCYVPYAIFFDRLRELYIAKIDRPQSLINTNKVKDKAFDLLLNTFVNDTNYTKARQKVLDVKLDSLYQNDLTILQHTQNRTPNQEIILKQLVQYFERKK